MALNIMAILAVACFSLYTTDRFLFGLEFPLSVLAVLEELILVALSDLSVVFLDFHGLAGLEKKIKSLPQPHPSNKL